MNYCSSIKKRKKKSLKLGPNKAVATLAQMLTAHKTRKLQSTPKLNKAVSPPLNSKHGKGQGCPSKSQLSIQFHVNSQGKGRNKTQGDSSRKGQHPEKASKPS